MTLLAPDERLELLNVVTGNIHPTPERAYWYWIRTLLSETAMLVMVSAESDRMR